MNLKTIAGARLASQQIAHTTFKRAKDIVRWMGAMQAQDYAMAKWALGVRLPGSTDAQIEAAINSGEILRTHVLRPTWHFVSPKDIYWMMDLSAEHIRTAMRSRDKELGLTEAVFKRSNAVLSAVLSDGIHRTREELTAELKKAKLPTDDNKVSHYFMRAEIEQLITSGAAQGRHRTYTLLKQRVPKVYRFSREESLARLARTYFTGHAPATLQDFVWWSGLSVVEARYALEMIQPKFIPEVIGGKTYWLPDSFSISTPDNRNAYLLPAFDEFLVGYRDRTATLTRKHTGRAVSSNSIFWPIIVIGGQVTGLWKRTTKKGKSIVETEFFRPHRKTEMRLIEYASLKAEYFVRRAAP